jgi:hypothetical protein
MDNRYIVHNIEDTLNQLQGIVNQLKIDRKIPSIYIELALAKLKSLFIEFLLLNKSNSEIKELKTTELYQSIEDQFDYLLKERNAKVSVNSNKDLFKQEGIASYQEIAVQLKPKTKQKNLTDLRNMIDLNDKIWFIKELFGGSIDLYNQTINYLNQLENLSQAVEYLNKFYQWNHVDTTTKDFFEIVSKRFE